MNGGVAENGSAFFHYAMEQTAEAPEVAPLG